jgi:hypothetical protein
MPGLLAPNALEVIHTWGGPVGALFVVAVGYVIVGRHRRLVLDEVLAGIGLMIWIVADIATAQYFGGHADPLALWGVRGAVLLALIVAYALVRTNHARRKRAH